MLSKRVYAISADKAFAKRIAAGVMAAGATAENVARLDDLPKGDVKADLVVYHLAEAKPTRVQAAIKRFPAETQFIVVIPTSSLELTVEVMKTGRVAAVLVADRFESAQLSALASRLLYGDLFGLEKVVPWGVKVYSLLVGDYLEKSVAIATISDFAASMGVRRKYRESIEQCLDEMLMNALYDAPVDAAGKQVFAEMPTKTRISIRMEQKAIVQYACDGRFFALSVRDGYGALQGETVVRYLDKCLHADQQIDRKAGGAGLGLYIISNAASQFFVNIAPSVATEALCLFDLTAPKVQLQEFGIFQEKLDVSARLAAGQTRRVSAAGAAVRPAGSSRGVTALLSAAIVLLLALIGVVAYPRLRPAPRGDLVITTNPPGATVEVDGQPRGTTAAAPLVVPALIAGDKYKVAARREGYEPAVDLVTVDQGATDVVLTLEPLAATLVVTSRPAGATVVLDGQEVGVTPFHLSQLPPSTERTIILRKAGYTDLEQAIKMPGPGTRDELQVELQPDRNAALLRIESDPPGAEVLQNGDPLAGLKTPITDHVVRAGRTYTYTMRLPGHVPEVVRHEAQPGANAPIVAKLRRGGVLKLETNVREARMTVVGVDECTNRPGPQLECRLPDGKYRVRIVSSRPYVAESFNIRIDGADVVRKLDLGFVQTASPDVVLRIPGAPAGTRRAAFSDGEYRLTLVDRNGHTVVRPVKVVAGRTVTVDARR